MNMPNPAVPRQYSRFSDAKAEEILQYIGEGMSQKKAIEHAGVSRSTFYSYMNRNAGYKERLQSIVSGNGKHNWKEVKEFACNVAEEDMLAVLKLLQEGKCSTIKAACKEANVSVYQFHTYISMHPAFSKYLRAALATSYVDLLALAHDIAKGRAPGQEGPDTGMVKWLLVNGARLLPEDSALPRLSDKQEVEQKVIEHAKPADIIDIS